MSTQFLSEAQATLVRYAESDPPQIIIVIPVYNHSGTLRDVVTRSLKVHDRVMVVDDGSNDGGIDTLNGLEVDIVRHSKNLGKGAAIAQIVFETIDGKTIEYDGKYQGGIVV